MKHRTDLRRAHGRIRSLERELALARRAARKLTEMLVVASVGEAQARHRLREAHQDAEHLRRASNEIRAGMAAALFEWASAPLWRIAAGRLRAWLARSCR